MLVEEIDVTEPSLSGEVETECGPESDPNYSPKKLLRGQIITGGKELYEIVGSLTESHSVYHSKDIKSGKEFALKHFDAMQCGGLRFLLEFSAQSEIQKLPEKKNILQMHDCIPNDRRILTPLVHGESLEDYLNSHKYLRFEKAVELAIGICEGVRTIHSANIIHRDIKESNILLQNGEPIIFDFDMAYSPGSRLVNLGSVKDAGTHHYMAPERWNHEEATQQSDIFSVGVILYRMVEGRFPFQSKYSWQVREKIISLTPKIGGVVPEALRKIISKSLDKEKYNRYQTAGEMVESLKNLSL